MTEHNISGSSLQIVFNQLKDVLTAQKKLVDRKYSNVPSSKSSGIEQSEVDRLQQELEDERREHEKTKALLASQSDKFQYALGEIEILTAQLTREKKLFESSFGRISERVKKESSKSQQLETKCTTIKAEKEKQEEILAFKDSKILDLKKRLASQKENHQRHLEEVKIQMEQEAYISRNLSAKQGRDRTLRNSSLR
ncbi:spermatogenesis-associated protein 24-like [Lytechinus pictus]|uniref:spermatogenesis-associated protein 24-like n=1 Tax=Lytechinus pictus TaxID=7653 RepID=UPI0030BA2759